MTSRATWSPPPLAEVGNIRLRLEGQGGGTPIEHLRPPPPHPSPASGRGSTPSLSLALTPFRRNPPGLSQPALAPPVVLALAERFAAAFRDAEVEFLHVLVLAQRLGVAVEHHAAAFQHVAVARIFQRHAGVLLRKQKRNPFLGIEIGRASCRERV